MSEDSKFTINSNNTSMDMQKIHKKHMSNEHSIQDSDEEGERNQKNQVDSKQQDILEDDDFLEQID